MYLHNEVKLKPEDFSVTRQSNLITCANSAGDSAVCAVLLAGERGHLESTVTCTLIKHCSESRGWGYLFSSRAGIWVLGFLQWLGFRYLSFDRWVCCLVGYFVLCFFSLIFLCLLVYLSFELTSVEVELGLETIWLKLKTYSYLSALPKPRPGIPGWNTCLESSKASHLIKAICFKLGYWPR